MSISDKEILDILGDHVPPIVDKKIGKINKKVSKASKKASKAKAKAESNERRIERLEDRVDRCISRPVQTQTVVHHNLNSSADVLGDICLFILGTIGIAICLLFALSLFACIVEGLSR